MSGDVEKIAAALAEALGTPLSVASSREWNSVSFSGLTIVFRLHADLPTISDDLSPDMPGFLLVDLSPAGPRGLEALVVRDPAVRNHLRTHKGDPM